MTLSDEQFDDLVASEAFGDTLTPDQAACLDSDRQHWRRSLVSLLEDIRVDITEVNHEMQKIKAEKAKGWQQALADAAKKRTGLVQDQVSTQQALARVKNLIGGPVMRPDDALRGLADAIERFVPPLLAAGILDVEAFQKAINDAADPERRAVVDELARQ